MVKLDSRADSTDLLEDPISEVDKSEQGSEGEREYLLEQFGQEFEPFVGEESEGEEEEEAASRAQGLPTAAVLERMTAEQLREQLLAERDTRPAAPGDRGSRNLFRLDPPSLDDHHNYKTFERALYHWTDNTDGTDKQKAAAVVGALGNNHKIKKNLKHHLMTVKDRAGMQELGMK